MDKSKSDETSSSSENDEVVIQPRYPLGYAYKNHPSGNESHILEPHENVAGSVRLDITEKSSGSLEIPSDNSCFNKMYGDVPWERRRIFPQPGRLPFQKAVNEYEELNESRDNTSTQEELIATNQLEISQTQEEGKGTGDATETTQMSTDIPGSGGAFSSGNDEDIIKPLYPLGYDHTNLLSGNESYFPEPQKNVILAFKNLEKLLDDYYVKIYKAIQWERIPKMSPAPAPVPLEIPEEIKKLIESYDYTSTQEEPITTNQLETSQTQEEGKGTGDATETAEKSSINISPNLSDKESLKTDASGVRIPVNKIQTEVPKTGKKARKNQPKKREIAATFSKSGYSDDAGLLKDQNEAKEEIGRKKFPEKVKNILLKSEEEPPADHSGNPPADQSEKPPADHSGKPPADHSEKPPADQSEKPNLVPEKSEKSESQNKIVVEQGKGPIENVATGAVMALAGSIDVLQPNELDNPSDKDQIRSYVDKSMLHIEYNNICISVFVEKGAQVICKRKLRPVAHVDASDV